MISKSFIVKAISLLLLSCFVLSSCAVGKVKNQAPVTDITTDDISSVTESNSSTDGITSSDDDNILVDVQRPTHDAEGNKDSTESSTPETTPETTPEVTEPEDTYDEPYDEPDVFVPYDVPLSIEDQQFVVQTAEQFGIQPELVFGIMYVESRYNKNAVGKNSKYLGIMQVAVSNLKSFPAEYGITDLMNFKQNVMGGCYMLYYYSNYSGGSINFLLFYYHGGFKYAERMMEEGNTSDAYTRKVMNEMFRIAEVRAQKAAEMGVQIDNSLI